MPRILAATTIYSRATFYCFRFCGYYSRAASIRRNSEVNQGVVTYTSPVEAFATAIKVFDWQTVLDRLISKGQCSNCSFLEILVVDFLQFGNRNSVASFQVPPNFPSLPLIQA